MAKIPREMNKTDAQNNVLCLACERPTVWETERGRFTSPMETVEDEFFKGLIHGSCRKGHAAKVAARRLEVAALERAAEAALRSDHQRKVGPAEWPNTVKAEHIVRGSDPT